MVQALKSEKSGRVWHYLHLDMGTVAIANWYRSPSDNDEQILELDTELAALDQAHNGDRANLPRMLIPHGALDRFFANQPQLLAARRA